MQLSRHDSRLACKVRVAEAALLLCAAGAVLRPQVSTSSSSSSRLPYRTVLYCTVAPFLLWPCMPHEIQCHSRHEIPHFTVLSQDILPSPITRGPHLAAAAAAAAGTAATSSTFGTRRWRGCSCPTSATPPPSTWATARLPTSRSTHGASRSCAAASHCRR